MPKTLSAQEYGAIYGKSIGSFEISQVHLNALQHLQPRSGEKILDAGCGEGELVKLLIGASAQAIGLDYSPKAIETAREKVPAGSFLVGDITALSFPNQSFDKIAALGVVGYLSEEDLKKAFGEFNRALRTGGLLLIRTPHPLNKIGAVLLRLLKKDYRSKSYYRSKRFLSALLQEHGFVVTKTWLSLDEEPGRLALKRAVLKIMKPFFASLWLITTKQ